MIEYIPLPIVISFAILFSYKLYLLKSGKKTSLASIWISGLIAFFVSIINALSIRKSAFEEIASSGEVRPDVLAENMVKIYDQLILGTSIFFGSLLIWLVLYLYKRKITA